MNQPLLPDISLIYWKQSLGGPHATANKLIKLGWLKSFQKF